MLDLFKKHTNISDLIDTTSTANLSWLQHNKGITFKSGLSHEEMITDYQRMLASTRLADISGEKNVILKNVDSEESVNVLNKMFKSLEDKSKSTIDKISSSREELPKFMFAMSPHEAESYTLGQGSGIYRHSALDLSYTMDMPHNISELYTRSMTNSTKLIGENRILMASMSGKLTPEIMEEYSKSVGDVPVYDSQQAVKEGIGNEWLWADGEELSAIRSPEVFYNSMFSAEKNKNGFYVKQIGASGKEGYQYIPSAEWFGGLQQLEDGSFKPARDEADIIAKALSSAAQNEHGALQGRALEDLKLELAERYPSWSKMAEMHIEGRAYEKLIDSQSLVDIHRKLSSIDKDAAREADYLLGNISLTSRKEYVSNIRRELDNAIIQGGSKENASETLERLYGENLLSDSIKKYKGNWDSSEIANMLADRSETAWENVKSRMPEILEEVEKNNIGAVEKLKSFITKNADINFITRYPNLFSKSTVTSLGFVSPELGDSRQIAAGHVIKDLMKGDTDGDALHRFSMISKAAKDEAVAHFDKENRIAFEYITEVKNNKMMKALISNDEKFTAISDVLAPHASEWMASLEKEQVRAAMLTKQLTGTATVRAWSQMGYYEDKIYDNKKLSRQEYIESKAFINTFFPEHGPQSIISSKHARAIYSGKALARGEIEHFASMGAVLENLGNIDAESLNRSITQLGSVHPLMEWALTDAKHPSNEKHLRELNKDGLVNDILSLHDMQTKWRAINDQEIENIHKRGWAGDKSLEDFRTQIKSAQENTIFWQDNESLKSAFNIDEYKHAMDFMSKPVLERSSSSEVMSAALATTRKKMKDIRTNNTAEYNEEHIKLALDEIENNFKKRQIGRYAFLNDASRGTGRIGERTVYPLLERASEIIRPHMNARNATIAAGAAFLAVTAMNLLSGDGTPEDLNDLPSHNNPSFHNTRYNDNIPRSSAGTSYTSNLNNSLLTRHATSQNSLMNNINDITGRNGYNSSTVIHDGTNPYKEDMHTYGS
jgi:hypothetical protein